ncbi:hypothetical protein ACFOWX_09220 [Sphingorhabdus arenilitoris]|uniref:DUF11 domain-containing protein n=1 Tax=Sphingorhabdus arenilitoris TaxID=1490041 RepID=A0ABV8RH53_9SPHN
MNFKTSGIKKLPLRTAYAAALMLAAASGSVIAFASSAFAQTAPAQAQAAPVTLSSKAMIERSETGADGVQKTVLKDPSEVIVVPGDRVVFTLTYENRGSEPAVSFRATNPMPGPIQFISAAEEWAEMSVDGGVTWGRLEQLSVTDTPAAAGEGEAEGGGEGQQGQSPAAPITRSADAKDVTHVRWVFTDPIPAGAKGSISYRGVVK